MNHLGESRLCCWNFHGQQNEEWSFRLCEIGGIHFVEIERTWCVAGARKTEGGMVEFRRGHQRTELNGSPAPLVPDATAIADLFSRALDFKKSEDGVWIPKVKPGDALIIDKPGAPEFKIFDLEDQAFEKVPKRSVEVLDDKPCTCPFTTLMSSGCACGGRPKKRLPPGLREIPA